MLVVAFLEHAKAYDRKGDYVSAILALLNAKSCRGLSLRTINDINVILNEVRGKLWKN